MGSRPVITRGLSGYLDLLRFGAAFVVLLSHFAYTRFTDGQYSFIRELNLGSDAVVLFFVLSGFVITFAATQKDKTAGPFAFSRLTRLWSVAIPALALALVFDGWGVKVNPEFYLDAPYYNAVGALEYWWRGLTFSSHWAGDTLRLGSNGPYWSLSYEAAYYIAFGIFLYLSGLLRWLALGLCALIFGLKIWLLAPAWFMGVGLYIVLSRADFRRYSALMVKLMIVTPIFIYILCQMMGLPETLRVLTYVLIGPEQFAKLGFSDEFIWNALIGALFTLHLFGVSILLSGRVTDFHWQAAVKWLAGGSFSLYLVHYPVLQWGGAIMPSTGIWVLDDILLLSIVCLICYGFAAIFERPLPYFRKAILMRYSRRNAVQTL